MNRTSVWTVLAAAVLAVAVGQTKVVTLRDGRKMEGQVTVSADGKSYEIKTKSGVTVSFPADHVVSVEELVTPADEYAQRLEKIDPNSATDRYELALWAHKEGLLEKAREQLREALKLKPDYLDAQLLLRQVNAKIRATSRPARLPGPTATQPARGRGQEWLLSDDDVSRIRLEELQPDDVVSIRFRDDVLDRFVTLMQGRQEFVDPEYENVFYAMRNVDKALYILENVSATNSQIKDDIRVQSDPRVMLTFKSRIWPSVRRRCATPTCHGGEEPVAGLKFYSVMSPSDRAIYTNYLILDTYKTGGWRMINRSDPDLSLLVQLGLPPDQAQVKHPGEISPMFTGRQRASYRRTIDWIRSLKGPPHPKYRLEWKPPPGLTLDVSGGPQLPPPGPAEPVVPGAQPPSAQTQP